MRSTFLPPCLSRFDVSSEQGFLPPDPVEEVSECPRLSDLGRELPKLSSAGIVRPYILRQRALLPSISTCLLGIAPSSRPLNRRWTIEAGRCWLRTSVSEGDKARRYGLPTPSVSTCLRNSGTFTSPTPVSPEQSHRRWHGRHALHGLPAKTSRRNETSD
jgi:hypothetical protein